MSCTVISSRLLHHPLNPSGSWNPRFIRLLDALEKGAEPEDLVEQYLRLKGFYGHPKPNKILPDQLVSHLKAIGTRPVDDGVLQRLVTSISPNTRLKPNTLSGENKVNLCKLFGGLMDIYREHVAEEIKQLEAERDTLIRELKELSV